MMTEKKEELTREEWIDRYARRISECSGFSQEDARRVAEVAADDYELHERAANNALVWEHPEDAADDEMSYWTDYGED